MEEDIKILEEKIKKYKTYNSNVYDIDLGEMMKRLILDGKEVQILENLLTRYKQLEKEIEDLKEQRESFIWQSEFDIKVVEKDYIPKSKVKEKIEEYKKNIDIAQGEELLMLDSKVDVLEELLREE